MKTLRVHNALLIGVLLTGSAIAWSTVTLGFVRFYRVEGTILKFTNCALPNPLATPCFYGAVAFLIVVLWSVTLARRPAPEARSYRYLWWLLLASTVFGWSNVAYEFWIWNQSETGTMVSCTADTISSPLQSPCLYGSTMFLGGLITVSVILQAFKRLKV